MSVPTWIDGGVPMKVKENIIDGGNNSLQLVCIYVHTYSSPLIVEEGRATCYLGAQVWDNLELYISCNYGIQYLIHLMEFTLVNQDEIHKWNL